LADNSRLSVVMQELFRGADVSSDDPVCSKPRVLYGMAVEDGDPGSQSVLVFR